MPEVGSRYINKQGKIVNVLKVFNNEVHYDYGGFACYYVSLESFSKIFNEYKGISYEW